MADFAYDMRSDFTTVSRLDLWHYIAKDAIGYTLHPNIALETNEVWVADIKTSRG